MKTKICWTILLLCCLLPEAEAQHNPRTNCYRMDGEGPFGCWPSPIRKGDSMVVHIKWSDDPRFNTKSIAIENVHTPTPEEVEKRAYSVVLKPERTTWYKVIRYLNTPYYLTYDIKDGVTDIPFKALEK